MSTAINTIKKPHVWCFVDGVYQNDPLERMAHVLSDPDVLKVCPERRMCQMPDVPLKNFDWLPLTTKEQVPKGLSILLSAWWAWCVKGFCPVYLVGVDGGSEYCWDREIQENEHPRIRQVNMNGNRALLKQIRKWGADFRLLCESKYLAPLSERPDSPEEKPGPATQAHPCA